MISDIAHDPPYGHVRREHLAQLRRVLEPQGVRIEGRPNVGLQLVGEELAIRLAVLRHCFHVAYGNYPLDAELEAALARTCRAHGLDEATARDFVENNDWPNIQRCMQNSRSGNWTIEINESGLMEVRK